jgi:hypothetical protein
MGEANQFGKRWKVIDYQPLTGKSINWQGRIIPKWYSAKDNIVGTVLIRE